MKFHDITLPSFISAFAVAKTIFPINLASTKSGREIRIPDRERFIKKYLIRNCKLSKMQFEEFASFFYGRGGMNYAFRFTDYGDMEGRREPLKNILQANIYQLVKRYDDLVKPYERIITNANLG